MSGFAGYVDAIYEGTSCLNSTHVNGCPCRAGGDIELRPEYVSFPMCLWCGENPGTRGVIVAVEGEVEPFAGVCEDCWELGE